MIRKIILLVSLCGVFLYSKAQPGSVMPSQPQAGTLINVSYNTSDPKAKLNGKEPVYARIVSYLEDGSFRKLYISLKGSGNALKGDFKLPERAASLKVEFYTLNRDDEPAAISLLVYNGQKPVQGAYMDGFFSPSADSLFKAEISNYPQNYIAYARYINVASMTKDPDEGKKIIQQLLTELQGVKTPVNRAGWLAALCVGYAKIARLNEGKAQLFKLFDEFPSTAETAFAFSIYNYEYYKATTKEVEDDVREKLRAVWLKYPDAALCKDENVFHYLQKDKEISVNGFERVLKPQYAAGTVSYHGLYNLPEVYIAANTKIDTAIAMLKDGLLQFQNGSINHQYRLNNSHYQLYVPLLYLDLIKAYMIKKEYSNAITSASAALHVLSGSNTEGNLTPLLLPLRAEAFKRIGNMNFAMADYQRLYLAGEKSMLDSMRNIFQLCNLKPQTFEQFEAGLKTGQNTAGSGLQMAPEFTATNLQGKPVKMETLKGKVVVINIWGIGCGPCIAEMPKLNEVVQQYAGKDVVFLGITGDDTLSLKKFFKSRKFDYQVINNAGNISEKFNTNALPVHIVINKKGEIVSRSIGAREDIKTFLTSVIDAQL